MKTVKPILRAIREAGFSHLKVELEAQLNRGGRASTRWIEEPCEECSHGTIDCENCNAQGSIANTETIGGITRAVLDHRGRQAFAECASCRGEGALPHATCEGSGVIRRIADGNFGSEDYCKQWILENVSREAKESLNYSKFYYDGSVDSEMTFTLPVESAEYIVEFINAFNRLAEAVGHGIDVAGAGMHIAVLADGCGGNYPTRVAFNDECIDNFTREVTKLLPALFLAASGGSYSRPLRYRHPQISSSKYSAIHVMNGCLEFRLFETCYDRPEAIFEFLGTIAKTLEFYKDPSKKVERLNKQYPFFSKTGTEKFVETVEQIRIIKKQLKYVLPEGISVKEFEATRGVKLTITETQNKERKKISELRKLFKEHVKAYKTALDRPLTVRESMDIERLRIEYQRYGDPINEDVLKAQVMGLRVPNLNESTFIRQNLPMTRGSEVTLTV